MNWFGTRLKALLSLVVLVGAIGLAPAQPAREAKDGAAVEFGPKVKREVLASMTELITKQAFVPGVDFNSWPKTLATIQSDLDAADTPAKFVMTVNRALRQYGLSHIVLFSPVAATSARTNRMVGIGVRIQIEDAGIRVVRLFEGGPADAAGMQPGDLIVKSDGKPVKHPSELAGEAGQALSLTFVRDGVEMTRRVVRREFSMDVPETLSWVDPNAAVLTIPSFDRSYSPERVNDLMQEANKADMLVLDLRGNVGGRVINLLHLLAYFFPTGSEIGTFIERRHLDAFVEEHQREPKDLAELAAWVPKKVRPTPLGTRPYRGKVAVLVDRGTGSAAEMMAAALREKRQAVLVGSPTAGAVLASLMRPLAHGYLLQFPVTDYVTTAGLRLEGNGLKPDIEAVTPRFNQEDEGLEAALAVLRSDKDRGGIG